jgi:hypothetical protein
MTYNPVSMMQLLHRYADFATWLGLLGTLVGFVITIAAVLKSKTAAEQTRGAVAAIRQKLSTQAAVIDLNRIIAEVEELRLLHRSQAWAALPTRYSSLRKQLLALNLSSPAIKHRQMAAIQGVIRQFSRIEEIVESALQSGTPPPDSASLHRTVAEQADELNGILVKVQRSMGA